MTTPETFTVLVALLFLGAWGWGAALVAAVRRAGWDTVEEEVGPPLQMLLGVALFLAVGGFLVALDVARVQVLVGWHVVGVALLVARAVPWARRSLVVDARTTVAGVAVAAAGVAFYLVSVAIAIGIPHYNKNDDDAAYVYLAQRLLRTGGLIDPFNQRRLASYGGSTLYQSMFLHFTGNSSIRGFEFVFGALLLVALAVRTARRRWYLPGLCIVGIGLLVGHGIGPVVNLSPEYSVAAVSLGTYQMLARAPLRAHDEQPMVFVLVGILLAGILSLRFSFAISVGLAVLLVLVALRGRRSIQPLALVVATTLVASTGWAIASWRSSRTPLFPVVAGNYDTTWPGAHDPYLIGTTWFTHLFGTIVTGWYLWQILLLSAVVGLGFLVLTRRRPVTMLVLLAATVGCLVQLAVLVYTFSGSDVGNITRFEAPSVLACGLFALDALWLCRARRPARESAASAEGSEGRPRRSRAGRILGRLDISPSATRRRLVGAVMTVLLVLTAAATFGSSLPTFLRSTRAQITTGYDILSGRAPAFADRYAELRGDYGRLNAMIPARSKVLAAVDYPALLYMARYDVATLDIAGSTSPAPHMPFFRGVAAKVGYLRRLGYQYVVADSPLTVGLFDIQLWKRTFGGNIYAYKAWTPYFLDWQGTVTWLEQSHRFDVRYAGSLALIRLDQPSSSLGLGMNRRREWNGGGSSNPSRRDEAMTVLGAATAHEGAPRP